MKKATDISIVDYTKDKIIIKGNTTAFDNGLKEITGGNKTAGGWIFPATKKQAVEAIIGKKPKPVVTEVRDAPLKTETNELAPPTAQAGKELEAVKLYKKFFIEQEDETPENATFFAERNVKDILEKSDRMVLPHRQARKKTIFKP